MRRRRMLQALPAAAAALAGPAAALAQAQPAFDRTLRIVVPFAPGGTSDILARILAPELTRSVGQTMVVENRPGAVGNLGADAVAKAPPDGHTLPLIDAGILATASSLFARLPFDARRDLAPAMVLIYAPYILAVHPSPPVRTARELAGYARANPSRVGVAHSRVGAANHLTALMLAQRWGADPTMVPYRGGVAALAAAAGGGANPIVNGATTTQPFVQNGTLRGLAVSGPHRLAAFPDLPTFAELGWPATDCGTWPDVVVPGQTPPPPMVARLDGEFRALLGQPAIARRIAGLGGEVRADGPATFRRRLDRGVEGWGEVIRANAIKLD